MRLRELVGAAVVAAGVATASDAHAGDALDKPSFTATADELLAAAKAAPAGDWPVVILRADDERSVDDDGRVTSRWRWVFVVRSQAGVDDWGTFSSNYQPFYQDRPELEVRVIDPGGTITELDQSLVTDTPLVDAGANVFSDTRNVEAPLPRLKIGAVVEEEVITKDRQPVLDAGGVELVWIGAHQPVLSTRVTLSAPIKRKATVVTRELPAGAKLARSKPSGREQWIYTIGKLDPFADLETMAPGDVHQRAYVGLATAASWTAVAKSYNKLVDGKIAEGTVTLPSGLPTTATTETVAAIVAWLHEHVRYTGIEFGEASNIPWTPAETVKRGFGDCKDKATLLIALLRQAGITADLALLSTGPGLDLDPDLPGMGVFDHAIVRARIGKTDIWIDATDELARPGQLPGDDQGRQALVISDATRGLVKTPASAAKDNVIREVRTYALAEENGAQVTEVTDETGAFEPGWRGWVRDTRADDMKKNLTRYVDDQYLATLDSYKAGDPAALDQPLEMTIVAADSGRAFTNRGDIDVHLFPKDALTQVPQVLADDAARVHDFAWTTPHVYEIENRLVMPPGFTAPTLPKDRTRTLGTTTLQESFRVDGATVIATYRFESGKARLTAKEFTAVRDALAPVRKEDLHLRFEHTGWALADRGKYKEALAEIDALIKLHPKEAIHYTQRAYVLIQAGMGDAARRAARKAVEIEPKNADAYSVLGWTLRRDTLGRDLGFDHDRAGAISAYKKGLALNPKHLGANLDLAELLTHGSNGRKWDAGSDPAGAEKYYRAALAISDEEDTATAVIAALLWGGKAADAEAFARGRTASFDRDAAIVTAVVVQSGPDAGDAEARRLRTGAEVSTVLQKASATLMLLQRYDDARAVSALLPASSHQANTDLLLKRIAPHKLAKLSKDPRPTIDELFMVAIDPTRTPKIFWDTRAEAAVRGEVIVPLGSAFDNQLLSMTYWRDAMLSLLDTKIEGTGPWRISVDLMAQSSVFYLAVDGGVAKIVGTTTSPSGVGRLVRKLAAKKNLEPARTLLDWVAKDAPKADFTTVWGPGLASDKDAVLLAAALLADGTDPDATGVLTACSSTVTTARAACDRALMSTYLLADRWTDMLDHASDWLTREPDAYGPQWAKGYALAQLGKFDDADAVAAENLKKHPGSDGMVMLQITAALGRARNADAIALMTGLATRPNPDPIDLNHAAWLELAVGTDLDAAIDLAQRADMLKKDETHIINTMAAIHAERGELAQARADEHRAMATGRRARPDGNDEYVFGRIAEQLGLRDDAIAAYRRVGPDSLTTLPTSRTLADKRLRAMGVTR